MILCDPKPIRSGLFAAIDALVDPLLIGEGGQWKVAATQDCRMTEHVREQLRDVYNQTWRCAPGTPLPACKIPWLTYLAIKKAQRKKFTQKQIKLMEGMARARYFGRLYGDVPRPVRPTDSLFDEEDEQQHVEDANALLLAILAKGAYAPLKPDEEEEAEVDISARVEILPDDDEEDNGMEFELPPDVEITQQVASVTVTASASTNAVEGSEEERSTKKIKV